VWRVSWADCLRGVEARLGEFDEHEVGGDHPEKDGKKLNGRMVKLNGRIVKPRKCASGPLPCQGMHDTLSASGNAA
jgi:hypothetical protein